MPYRSTIIRLIFAFVVFFICSTFGSHACAADTPSPGFAFVCNGENDLYKVLVANQFACTRFDDPMEAVNNVKQGGNLLILADEYPLKQNPIPKELFEKIKEKSLRVYMEYPDAIPGQTFAEPRRTRLERVVVTSDVFGTGLRPMDLLAIHDCHFLETDAEKPYLSVAPVAGYDTAVYGLDDVKSFPILYEIPDQNILVCTSKLSHFVTGRHATKSSVKSVLTYVLQWLVPEQAVPDFDWQPIVGPTYAKDEPLPDDARLKAIQRGIDWHGHAGMVLNEKGWDDYQKFWDPKTGDALGHDGVGEWPDTTPPYGDGRYGILEGAYSQIDSSGNQKAKKWLRCDSNGESSLAFALRWKLDNDPWSRNVAENVLDWLYFTSGMFEPDPTKPNGGLLFWSPDNRQALYQDNDVKAIMGMIGTAAVLNTDKWDEVLVRNILGNYRTTGPLGFRGWRLEYPDVMKNGWQHYQEASRTNFSPHYEAWMWSTYLWLYDKTGYEPLLEMVKNGVRMMNEAYPERWFWASACSPIDYARMLLVCSWLVRVEDTPEHRKWLKFYADKLEELQDKETGAIREQVIDYPHLQFRLPHSNAAYGTSESGLAAKDGDPVTDQLYSTNFALFGLNEAYAATGEEQYKRMRDQLADFLIRIQVKSEVHPELDGGWFRAFDYEKWEYWGANADAGWGAWSIEVGWTQAWIPTSLALCELETNLWDLSRNSKVSECFPRILEEMMTIPTDGKKPNE